jgi:hypothetical protein
VIQIGVGDGCQQVGEARTGGAHRDAQLTQRPRVSFGSVPGGNLVPSVDNRDAALLARLEDSFEVCAMYSEDVPDARLPQCPNEELSARDHGHPTSPSSW